MIVIDASAAVELLLRTPLAPIVEKTLFQARETVHAPHLLDIEATQAIRTHVRFGNIDVDRASEALADLADFPLQRYSHTILLQRVWELRNALTAYDAVYVALAEALGASLLTCDKRLASTAKKHVRVEAVG